MSAGLLVIAVVVAAFILRFIPHYLSFNPALGRLSPAEHPWYFPVMVIHLLCGTVTLVACVLQVWPWLRRRHPRVHRVSGRVYVAAVWPAVAGAVVISVVWPFGPVSALSDIVHALLWLAATTYGFALGRQRRYADHRRWMLRSFALAMSNILNRVVGFPIQWVLAPHLATTFGGNQLALDQAVSACNSWLCWTLALIAMEWWLDRERNREPRSRPAPPAAEAVPAVLSGKDGGRA